MSALRFAAYYRVSTGKQEKSGLGLDAQKFAVSEYVKSSHGILLAEFTETESGRRRDRPQLEAALELCRRSRAILVIAKLDRLARNVAFVSTLLESGTKFVATDMPEADISFLQMAAVFGEWEARRISDRTKAALAAAKARGKLLGWAMPSRRAQQDQASRLGCQTVRNSANQFATSVLPLVQGIRSAGITTFDGVADALNARGITTPRRGKWHASTVRNLERRCAAMANGCR